MHCSQLNSTQREFTDTGETPHCPHLFIEIKYKTIRHMLLVLIYLQFRLGRLWNQVSEVSLLLLVCVSFTIIGQPRNSVLIHRVQPWQAAIQSRQGTGLDNARHRPGPATRTQTSAHKLPSPSAGTALNPLCAKTAQQKPPPREAETRLPDCGATHYRRESTTRADL